MERYELENGKVFEIIRWPDGCTVVKDGTVVYSGTYSGCRRYIEHEIKRGGHDDGKNNSISG